MDKNFSLPLPGVIRIEPNSVCNFRCRHCPIGLGLNKSKGVMSRENFDVIYEKIKHLHFRVAALYHGGEPLLSQNFFYFAEKMGKISDLVKTVSNSSLLTDEAIEKILNSPLGLIEFSLDGTSPEENDYIRRGSNFQKISTQIKKLLKRKKEAGSGLRVFISNVQIPKRGDDLKTIKVPQYLKEAFSDFLDVLAIRSYYAIYWPGYPRQNPVKAAEKPIRNFCDSIENTVTIRWNGDVVPCCYDLCSQMAMGNILKESLENIWNNKKYLALRRRIYNCKPPILCRGCNVLYKESYIYDDELKPSS